LYQLREQENSNGTYRLVLSTPSGIDVLTDYATPKQVELEARKFTFLPFAIIGVWITVVIALVLRYRKRHNKLSNFDAGIDPISKKQADIDRLKIEVGELEKDVSSTINKSYGAIDYLDEADQLHELVKVARLGHASALASHSWLCLETGRHQEALDLYVETRKTVSFAADSLELRTELANCDNNQALNLLASGNDVRAARQLWDSNKGVAESPECVFYSLVMKVRDGSATVTELSNLPKNLLAEMHEILNDGLTASGWYKQWCGQILSEFGSAFPEIKS
jgi:hypothetical protein